jgi:formaldehyde-activating enzyme
MSATFDGKIGEGWSGRDPNGAHVNVVLAERGTPTAAALLTAFTSPTPGYTPILVVVGEDKDHYEPVWPPTIMMNKATATEERHQTITWGAGQLGNEIKENVWLVCDADETLVFGGDHGAKWRRALGKIGVDPERLSSVAGRA